MDTVTWLLITNVIVWIGIGCYVSFIAARQKDMSKKLQQIKAWKDE